MALGEFQIFTWKSKATQETEMAQYEKWAFPYGQKQRDNLQALLLAVFPKGNVATTLVPFLTCKELYEGVLKKSGGRDMAVDTLLNTQKKYKRIITKKEMSTYIVLVLADAGIDESCEYPSAEDILDRAKELEKLRRED